MGRGERNRDQNDLPPLIFKGRAGEGLIFYKLSYMQVPSKKDSFLINSLVSKQFIISLFSI
jgi:hypothetical protein